MKLGVFVSDYTLINDTLSRTGADGLFLVANGVYHATKSGEKSALLDMTDSLFVLSEDLQTRGINEEDLDSKVKVVTYGDLVDVVFNDYEKIAWL